jgi:hypothetical protein
MFFLPIPQPGFYLLINRVLKPAGVTIYEVRKVYPLTLNYGFLNSASPYF